MSESRSETKSPHHDYFNDEDCQLEYNLQHIRLDLICLLEESETFECFECMRLRCICVRVETPIRYPNLSDCQSFSEVSSSHNSLPTEEDFIVVEAPPPHTLPAPVWQSRKSPPRSGNSGCSDENYNGDQNNDGCHQTQGGDRNEQIVEGQDQNSFGSSWTIQMHPWGRQIIQNPPVIVNEQLRVAYSFPVQNTIYGGICKPLSKTIQSNGHNANSDLVPHRLLSGQIIMVSKSELIEQEKSYQQNLHNTQVSRAMHSTQSSSVGLVAQSAGSSSIGQLAHSALSTPYGINTQSYYCSPYGHTAQIFNSVQAAQNIQVDSRLHSAQSSSIGCITLSAQSSSIGPVKSAMSGAIGQVALNNMYIPYNNTQYGRNTVGQSIQGSRATQSSSIGQITQSDCSCYCRQSNQNSLFHYSYKIVHSCATHQSMQYCKTIQSGDGSQRAAELEQHIKNSERWASVPHTEIDNEHHMREAIRRDEENKMPPMRITLWHYPPAPKAPVTPDPDDTVANFFYRFAMVDYNEPRYYTYF